LPELRKDYFTDRLVIISTERSKRPTDFKVQNDELNEGPCPFCPGNEEMTPPAVLVLVNREGTLAKLADSDYEIVRGWSVRIFPNKFPAVSPESSNTYSEYPFYSEPAFGYHYVIVASPNHDQSFAQIGVEQWVNILACLQDRVRWLYGQKGVSYVAMFVNSGRDAGASLSHPHLQMVTVPRLPPLLEQEALASQKSMNELGVCPMCSVLSLENGGPRQILTSDFYMAFSPWAPTHPFEFWIFPKRHETSFLKVTQKEMRDLALILRCTLGGLVKTLGEIPFNLVFHISSEKKTTKQIHWHIEVYPQLTKWAGLERGTGIYINPVSPESAAQLIGAASRKQLAELIGIT
jgi:UDPglucose--hexose-1-phosphate uridylyltransferase